MQNFFCTTDGFHPIPCLRDRLFLEEVAAANREKSERVDRLTPPPSEVGFGYFIPDTYYDSNRMSSSPGSPIQPDDQSIEIDVADVDYDQTAAPEATTTTLSKRSLEITDIEGSFKRGVTSALHQRPLFILDKRTISPSDATSFLAQANRWNDNFSLNEVIVGQAVELLQICIYGDGSFSMLSEADTPSWLELLTVAQAAELVMKYFGPRPNSGRTLAENFGNVSFSFGFLEPSYERETMMNLLDLTKAYEQVEGAITPEQHAHLIVLIEKRLPQDGQIRADYFAKRGPRPIANETWSAAMRRLHLCINDVRLSLQANLKYGDPAKVYHFQQPSLSRRSADDPDSSHHGSARAAPPQHALMRRSPTPPVAPTLAPRLCPSCGHVGHTRPSCPYLHQNDANNDLTLSWADSFIGRRWKSFGCDKYEVDLVLPGYETRFSVDTSGLVSAQPSLSSIPPPRQARFENDRGPRDTQRKPNHYSRQTGQQSRCESLPSHALVSAPLLSPFPDDYLPVTIFIDQTGHRKGTRPTPTRRQVVKTGALLDTGSLAGDFLSQDVVNHLAGHSLCYAASHPMTVCSGLDSTCYSSLRLLDIGVQFLTCKNIKQTIFLTASINPNTSIDLILGRQTLAKYNLFSLTPHALGIPHTQSTTGPVLRTVEPLSTLVTHTTSNTGPVLRTVEPLSTPILAPTPTPVGTTIPEAHRRHSGSTPNFCSRCNGNGFATQPCCGGEVHLTPCNVTVAEDKCDGDPHRHGIDLNRTTSLAPSREVGALLDTAAEVPSGIVLSVDEIDNDRTDTFRPFVSEQTQAGATPEDFLSKITFEGDEDLQRGCRALCLKYADIFSDNIAPLPAKLTPFEIKVDTAKWETDKNRGPVRPQSVKKEVEIDKALKEMLLNKIIERSNAVYYSHPVIVQRTANTFRFCIDYRNLNDCTAPASWPVPNIRGLFERIGHSKPNLFGVMDLTAGYHQAPLAPATRILTAFICFAGV